MLIKIEAIVREEKMEDVKAALNEIQVNGFTVTQIMGCGTQRGYTEYVRGSKIDVFLKPKIKFEIVVSSEDWEIKVIDAIQKAAFTCLLYTSTHSDAPVTEIAMQVGFNSTSYFIKKFQQSNKVSPHKYRKSMRQI